VLDLAKLFTDVFDPQAGELAGVMIDTPHADVPDNDEWRERRVMAARWHRALSELAARRGFAVLPLIEFSATGANNGELPTTARVGDKVMPVEEITSTATLLLALTEFSASAPLIKLGKRFPTFRAASMPRVAPQMEETALAADYKHVAQSCRRLRDPLAEAAFAEIEFSTGDTFTFDFRFREPEVDDGQMHRDQPPPRLINLPSGETFVAAYEGERTERSATAGVLPVWWEGAAVRLRIEGNSVEEVLADSSSAASLRAFLFADAARRNVAELGLGCNPNARVWGNVLEDEKAGPHIALGRSEHLGGTVGPDAFSDPRHVWHEDFVYARDCPITIRRMTLVNTAGTGRVLFADGSYDRELEIGI
jgi:leucyl aminopeptidase (aminopeptidase T)